MFIDCKSKAQTIKDSIKDKLELKPCPILTVVQVGDNSASNSYIKGKKKDCNEVGIICQHIKYPEDILEDELIENIQELQTVSDGIIVQLPLPTHINETNIINSIDPQKDVDGFRKDSQYVSCTPLGIMKILEDYNISGKDVLIINRSNIVGRPLVNLLLDKDATVTIAHSKTKDIVQKIQASDVIITAVGVPNFIKREYLKKGQIVIDVAVNRDSNNKLCGDVESGCEEIANVTPVPGGVGLMTRAALLINVYAAYERGVYELSSR